MGKAAVSRKSACPLSPEVVVLAQGFSLLEYVSISIKIIYTLSREERQAFVEATQVVYEEYMDNGLLTMDDLARMKRIIRGEEK